MNEIANRLWTAASDVRVTKAKLRGSRLTSRSVEAQRFALNMMHRLRQRPCLFAAVDTTLRRMAPTTLIQPLYQQNRFELSPRLTLTVRPERQIKTPDRQIEPRLLWRPAVDRAESSPAERIVRLVRACVERQSGLSPREQPCIHAAPAVHNIVTHGVADQEVHNIVTHGVANHLINPLHAVPNYHQPLAIEMVVHRPQSVTPTTAAAQAAEIPYRRPQVTEHQPVASSSQTMPPLDGSYLRHLTDSVVEALDRRTIASYERTGRRSS